MGTLITVIHIISSLFIILIVLLQADKTGGGLGAAFGGSSQTVFGSGAGNILTKITSIAVVIFITTTLLLTFYIDREKGLFEGKTAVKVQNTVKKTKPQSKKTTTTSPKKQAKSKPNNRK